MLPGESEDGCLKANGQVLAPGLGVEVQGTLRRGAEVCSCCKMGLKQKPVGLKVCG